MRWATCNRNHLRSWPKCLHKVCQQLTQLLYMKWIISNSHFTAEKPLQKIPTHPLSFSIYKWQNCANPNTLKQHKPCMTATGIRLAVIYSVQISAMNHIYSNFTISSSFASRNRQHTLFTTLCKAYKTDKKSGKVQP